MISPLDTFTNQFCILVLEYTISQRNMKQVYPSKFSPWEILIATFVHLLLAKVPLLHQMDECYIYTHGVSSDISHSRIKRPMDTNLLEVAGSSEAVQTLAMFDLLNSIRGFSILPFEYYTGAVQEFHTNNYQS